MARLTVAIATLVCALSAQAQGTIRPIVPPARARAVEAAVVAYAAERPAASATARETTVSAQPCAVGVIDRTTARRALVTSGPIAAVSFQGGPREVSAVEPPAQPLFFGVSLRPGQRSEAARLLAR